NLYLHSAIVQTRAFGQSERDRREAIRLATVDSTVSLGLAFFINAAILILAAATFHVAGRTDVAEIADAHRLLAPMLGVGAASTV
ncbi:divalent metal cation transporter, partial [Escherichia coli]|uniref:divalent metal cation transporter n=2 Tax=Pseudomonadota TaxID=1224 RepID=UPI003D03B3DF